MRTVTAVIEHFDGLFGGLRLPVIAFDAGGRLVKANAAFCELAGVPGGSQPAVHMPYKCDFSRTALCGMRTIQA